ncbi:hypothetical protein ACFQVA_29975 [Actinomadura keratinilytica]
MLRLPPRPPRFDVLIALSGLLGGLLLWGLGLHTRIAAPTVPTDNNAAWTLLPLAATAARSCCAAAGRGAASRSVRSPSSPTSSRWARWRPCSCTRTWSTRQRSTARPPGPGGCPP